MRFSGRLLRIRNGHTRPHAGRCSGPSEGMPCL